MLRTTLLLGALTGISLWLGQFLGGSGGLVIAFVFAVLMNFGAYWFSDKVVLAMYGRSLVRLFSTYPPLEERIARLRAMAGQRA